MRRIEGSKNVEKMKRSRSHHTEITKCMWHLNVIVCFNFLYFFAVRLCSIPLFHLKQTGADAGNAIEAPTEALEMKTTSHPRGVELKSHLVTKFSSKKPQSTIS